MPTPTALGLAPILADDPRADGGVRRVFIAADCIAIERRVAGVRMRLALPIESFRGVSLSLQEGARGAYYRVALDHADPDLRVTLVESEIERDIAPEWRSWAQFFQLPRLAAGLGSDLVTVESRLGALTLGAVQPRKRAWPLKGRRSRISAWRTSGPRSRVLAVYRDEREIICYE